MPASDTFGSFASGLEAPATRFFAVTPSDVADLAAKPRAIYVGVGGNLAISNAAGDSVTLQNVPAGVLLPIRADKVLATGTTAGGILAMY